MTFLVCRVHLHSKLGEFMVVVVTDRTQLQDQLSETLKLSESDVELARTVYSQLGDIGETASPATRSFSPPHVRQAGQTGDAVPLLVAIEGMGAVTLTDRVG
jgi:hypothetical protein